MPRSFDRDYYLRHYHHPKTRVVSRAEIDVLGDFVCGYLKYLRLPIRRVVDLGCGLGYWRDVVARHFPKARYVGVEFSEYLCAEHGWERGSVVDYKSKEPFDLVVCQGVLPYLNAKEANKAIANLGVLCRGALYLEALTARDWEKNCDRTVTDGDVYLRSADWYRRRLRRRFLCGGGGVWFAHSAPVVLYELELGR